MGLRPPVGYEYGFGVRPLKDHQLRNSVSAFNIYAFKTIGALPEDPRSHNKLLTQGWLRQRDLEYALHGTKQQVQRMVTANELSLEVVAKPQRACALCGIVRGHSTWHMYGVAHPTGMDVGRNTVASACLVVASSLLHLEHHLDTCSQSRGLLPATVSCVPRIVPMGHVELNMSSSPMTQEC